MKNPMDQHTWFQVDYRSTGVNSSMALAQRQTPRSLNRIQDKQTHTDILGPPAPKMPRTHWRKDSLYFSNKCCWEKNKKNPTTRNPKVEWNWVFISCPTQVYFKWNEAWDREPAEESSRKHCMPDSTGGPSWAPLELLRLYGEWSLME